MQMVYLVIFANLYLTFCDFRLTVTWSIQTPTKLKLYLKYLELIPSVAKPAQQKLK